MVIAEIPGGVVETGSAKRRLGCDLERYMTRFAEAYDAESMPKIKSIIAVAAAHHRFTWIHPFLDGNGRVARLMAHASLLRPGVGGSTWSIARGLARSNESYKAKLQLADQVRQGNVDDRGALSEKSLTEKRDLFRRQFVCCHLSF